MLLLLLLLTVRPPELVIPSLSRDLCRFRPSAFCLLPSAFCLFRLLSFPAVCGVRRLVGALPFPADRRKLTADGHFPLRPAICHPERSEGSPSFPYRSRRLPAPLVGRASPLAVVSVPFPPFLSSRACRGISVVSGPQSLSFPTTAGLKPFAEFILTPAEGLRFTGRQAVKAFL
jgi:hypothetical protein